MFQFSARSKNPSSINRSDRKSTRLNSSHSQISYAVFCLKKKKLVFHIIYAPDFFQPSSSHESVDEASSLDVTALSTRTVRIDLSRFHASNTSSLRNAYRA